MNKKKAKIVVLGNTPTHSGDAASGKSTLVQSYAKKNYQFTSDYNMVPLQTFRLKVHKSIPK